MISAVFYLKVISRSLIISPETQPPDRDFEWHFWDSTDRVVKTLLRPGDVPDTGGIFVGFDFIFYRRLDENLRRRGGCWTPVAVLVDALPSTEDST